MDVNAKLPREMTRPVTVGGVRIGGGAPVAVQSMTCTDTADAQATLAQVRALADAGCDLVRVSVPTKAAPCPSSRTSISTTDSPSAP